jgi:peptidoglycan hydrolase-like protein with peptidoglycan-binding domain
MQEVYVDPESQPSFWDLRAIQSRIVLIENEEACGGKTVTVQGAGVAAAPSPRVVRIDTLAPMPYLRKGKVSEAFAKLKTMCIEQAGFDFLAICGDVMRDRNYQTTKPGVASRSRHKVGQAFDYNQADKRLIIVSEPIGREQYFRTWLKCSKQDGSLGTQVTLKDIRGFTARLYAWDFTKAASKAGFERIPAWDGWRTSYTKKEFWHYQLTEGTTYDEALNYLYPPTWTTLAKGSKGETVKEYQSKLHKLGYFTSIKDVDGDFGPRTEKAVMAFQKSASLIPTGRIDSVTRNKIDQSFEERNKMSNEFKYDLEEINAASDAEADEILEPKPWYRTSAFYTLLTQYVVMGAVAFLVSKGIVDAGQAGNLTNIMASAVIAGIAWVSGKFIEGRTAVSVVKAKAAAVRALSARGPEALAAFKMLDRS